MSGGAFCRAMIHAATQNQHVFVLGDRRDHSYDSRYFGTVPETAILGRVAWIHFSHGPDGVRWERIGQRVR